MQSHFIVLPLPQQPEGIRIGHIPDWPGYAVTDTGTVWSCRKGGEWRTLQPRLNWRGAHRYRISIGKRVRETTGHRLVMEAFVGPMPDGCEVCHNNGDTTDNRLCNLRYDTHRNNVADAYKHGTACVGERHDRAVLTNDQVAALLREYKTGIPYRELAVKYQIPAQMAYRIVSRRTWKHVVP